jgi:hypothetical protein
MSKQMAFSLLRLGVVGAILGYFIFTSPSCGSSCLFNDVAAPAAFMGAAPIVQAPGCRVGVEDRAN